jgi:cell division protein FtsW
MKLQPILAGRTALDPLVIGTALVLLGIGAIMIGSASVSIANEDFGEPLYYLRQHFLALVLGTVALLVALKVPIDWWNRLSSLLLFAAVALLVAVLLPGVGDRSNGAQRWIELGPLSLQASELARLLLLMYLASYCVRQADALRSHFRGFARPMVLIGLCGILLLLEPDFGATVVLTTTALGLLFIAGARMRDVVLAGVVATIAFALLIWVEPYRWERLVGSFLDPWANQKDSGYQLVNAFIAIGSGNWFGVGLGEGVQKLHYLPEPHTDFIFAVLAEEFGFIGATAVVLLFALLVWRAVDIGQRALARGLPFHGLLAIGIGLMLGLQAAISIGVNTGLLPTKGLALPLISFGRTSAVVTLLALGLLLRIAHEIATARATESERRAQ